MGEARLLGVTKAHVWEQRETCTWEPLELEQHHTCTPPADQPLLPMLTLHFTDTAGSPGYFPMCYQTHRDSYGKLSLQL